MACWGLNVAHGALYTRRRGEVRKELEGWRSCVLLALIRRRPSLTSYGRSAACLGSSSCVLLALIPSLIWQERGVLGIKQLLSTDTVLLSGHPLTSH